VRSILGCDAEDTNVSEGNGASIITVNLKSLHGNIMQHMSLRVHTNVKVKLSLCFN